MGLRMGVHRHGRAPRLPKTTLGSVTFRVCGARWPGRIRPAGAVGKPGMPVSLLSRTTAPAPPTRTRTASGFLAFLARVFITGAADGLGLAAARVLLGDGHDVVVHVRDAPRLDAVRELLDRGAETVVADLSDVEQTRDLAGRVNRLGHLTREWLATGDAPDARSSGGHCHRRRRIRPHPPRGTTGSRTGCSRPRPAKGPQWSFRDAEGRRGQPASRGNSSRTPRRRSSRAASSPARCRRSACWNSPSNNA